MLRVLGDDHKNGWDLLCHSRRTHVSIYDWKTKKYQTNPKTPLLHLLVHTMYFPHSQNNYEILVNFLNMYNIYSKLKLCTNMFPIQPWCSHCSRVRRFGHKTESSVRKLYLMGVISNIVYTLAPIVFVFGIGWYAGKTGKTNLTTILLYNML